MAPGACSGVSVRGVFVLFGMVHDGTWDGVSDGTFSWRSRPCSAHAPVNNVSLNLPTFNSRLPGSRSPASTRTHLTAAVSGGGSRLHGEIVLTVCQPGPGSAGDDRSDEERDRILVRFDARAQRYAEREVAFEGSIVIAGGTGPYQDLQGEGAIAGYFFCSAEPGGRNNSLFCDGQYALHGRFTAGSSRLGAPPGAP